jgi:hypothetical protein
VFEIQTGFLYNSDGARAHQRVIIGRKNGANLNAQNPNAPAMSDADAIFRTAYWSAVNGDLDALIAATDREGDIDAFLFEAALENGHVHIADWYLREKAVDGWLPPALIRLRPPHKRYEEFGWNEEYDIHSRESVVFLSIDGGHLPLLKWARDHGCSFDADTCSRAAWRGHLHILQWLRSPEVDCPWDAYTVSEARREDHEEVALWALDNGCPRPPDVRPGSGGSSPASSS